MGLRDRTEQEAEFGCMKMAVSKIALFINGLALKKPKKNFDCLLFVMWKSVLLRPLCAMGILNGVSGAGLQVKFELS